MESYYQAYQAYEHRVEIGEFDPRNRMKKMARPSHREPLAIKLGDLLIDAGLRLKRRHISGKPMAWSPMTGSKQ